MTFLQMVRRVARACGMTNQPTVPADVVGQSGNLLDAIDWVQDSWRELQVSFQNWRWMRVGFTLQISAGVDTYAYGSAIDDNHGGPISRFARWLVTDPRCPPRAYLQPGGLGGQYYLPFIPWDGFQAIYRIGIMPPGMPVHISIDPQNRLVFGPAPDNDYVIVGEYQRAPQELVSKDDIPEMPEQFHMVIVYDAMRKYAGSEAASEIMVRAQTEGGALKSSLRTDQLPRFRDSSPLA